jgi:hypothetical protein
MNSLLLHGTVVLITALTTSSGWTEAPGREGTTPPLGSVTQETDRITEQSPAGSEQQKSSRHFEAKKRERLLQMLQLDDVTQGKLLQRLEQLDQKGEELRRERRKAFTALREQLKGLKSKEDRKARETEKRAAGVGVDQGALKTTLDRIYSVEDAMAGLRRERWQAARDLLTPEQQVKFLMYSVKFHKEMRERLEREHARPSPEASGEREKSTGDRIPPR